MAWHGVISFVIHLYVSHSKACLVVTISHYLSSTDSVYEFTAHSESLRSGEQKLQKTKLQNKCLDVQGNNNSL
jgi:hypothetical protein